MTTLSLCMIVKNEEVMLRGCLESVRNWVDEMIVVDTGSTDSTKAIAEECGATVYDFPWINDFAAARNFAKSKATCDYVLALDADERLYEADGPLLREKLEGQTTNVIFVKLVNAKSRFSSLEDVVNGVDMKGTAVYLPRILKNVEGNDWHGSVHETPAIPQNAQAISVFLVHLGGDAEWRQIHQKHERNLELLENMLEKDTNQSALFWSYISTEYFRSANYDKFYSALTNSWSKMVEQFEQTDTCTVGNAIMYPLVLLHLGEYEKGINCVLFIIKNFHRFNNPLNALYTILQSLIDVDFPKEMQSQISEIILEGSGLLLDLQGRVFIEETTASATDITAYNFKTFAYIKMARYEEALENIETTLTLTGDTYSTLLLQIECYLEQGNMEQCLLLTTELLQQDLFKGPDIWILSALAWLVLGYDEDANDAIKQAYMLSKMPFVSKHRLILLNGLLVRQQVLLGKPISGRGAYGVLGAILSREPLESTTSVPRDLIIKIVDSYLQKNHTALLNRFFDYRAEQILPGVKGVVLEHLASLGIVVEDDGVPTPIVLFGTEVTALQSLFESSSRYQVQHVDYAMVEEILAIWQSYQEQSIEDFLFGDLSFLGDDAETDDKAQIVQQIRGIVEKGYTDPTKRLVLIWPTISDNASLIKEVYPNAVGVFYAADPRADIVQGTITTEKLHQVFTENYTTKSNFDSFVYVNEVQLEKDVSVRISEIFATLGEVYEPTMVDVWKNAYGESPSETYEFDEKTQAFLEKWKFVV